MGQTSGLTSVGTNGGVSLLVTSVAGPVDSGVQMNEASGFTKWTFQLLGTFTGYSVQVYGTIDPAAKYLTTPVPGQNFVPHGNTAVVPATSWFPLDAPAAATGTTESNPLTATGQSLNHSGALVAVRVVATGTSQTGQVTVVGFATP